MSSLLFVEAFGQLRRAVNSEGIVSEDEEDLYSVFRARSELMGWSANSAGRPPLWDINEAELTTGIDAYRIGDVQVGLNVGDLEPTREPSAPVLGYRYAPLGVRQRAIEPSVALPALIQCFDDSLRRFGVVELSGLQVTANVSNQQKWDTLGAERSGAGWRSGELPEGPVVASSPFGGLSLHLLPAL